MLVTLCLALAFQAAAVPPDTTLISALVLAVDTAASPESQPSLRGRRMYVDVPHYLALAGGEGASDVLLPARWVGYDQELSRKRCRTKDGGCLEPGAAYVRILHVSRRVDGTLVIDGTVSYRQPIPRIPGQRVPRGASDSHTRLFTVVLSRSGNSWEIVMVNALEAA